ncbi:hypothetical protein IFM89_034642 [Coptis chinensis]|uniref:HECT-type E3 ubiquitin transferase n=1 Tax=Coptis chinensis TaxID=261450 RepID=A0A835LPJ1_9MAGN|nr:hypothetical protein IFM89_034642 [Coptis chinensis]
MDELHIFGEAEKALLSTTSTDGTAILRVLQALSSLVASLQEKEKDIHPEKGQSDALSQVWDINTALEPLWMELSTCISKIETYADCAPDFTATRRITATGTGVMAPLPAGTQNILPYIESFFVTCEKLHPGESGVGHEFGIVATADTEEAAASTSQQKTSGTTAKVGKALFDGQLLDVHFTRSFYKHILGVKVTYHDIEAIDPDYFKNLKWMLEASFIKCGVNDISDVLDLTFSMDADEEKLILYERTEVMDYELIPGGRNIRVTEENKHEYVDLVAEHRLTTAIRPQINAFLEGFNELISRDLISIFNDKELELLISGLPDIDLDDMRANTEYSGYSAASPIIQWFWEVVQGFSKEDKARLLQFVTGTSKVPLEGFSALQGISGSQRFQIHKAYGSPEHLPSAHTCFNQLDLPEYPSKQHLEERLLLAIHEANEGFGFG